MTKQTIKARVKSVYDAACKNEWEELRKSTEYKNVDDFGKRIKDVENKIDDIEHFANYDNVKIIGLEAAVREIVVIISEGQP